MLLLSQGVQEDLLLFVLFSFPQVLLLSQGVQEDLLLFVLFSFPQVLLLSQGIQEDLLLSQVVQEDLSVVCVVVVVFSGGTGGFVVVQEEAVVVSGMGPSGVVCCCFVVLLPSGGFVVVSGSEDLLLSEAVHFPTGLVVVSGGTGSCHLLFVVYCLCCHSLSQLCDVCCANMWFGMSCGLVEVGFGFGLGCTCNLEKCPISSTCATFAPSPITPHTGVVMTVSSHNKRE